MNRVFFLFKCFKRAGEKYGFNFEANYDQKIGVLRSFVRKKRTEDKGIKTRVGKKIYTENNINEVPKINKNIFQEDAEYNNITHNEQMLDEFYLNQKENNPNFFNFEENNQNFIGKILNFINLFNQFFF